MVAGNITEHHIDIQVMGMEGNGWIFASGLKVCGYEMLRQL